MEPEVIAAARGGDVAGLRRLLETDPAAAGARGWMGETALHAAAASGAAEAVRMLLAADAPVRARRDAPEGKARVLLEAGAEVDARDGSGQTPRRSSRPSTSPSATSPSIRIGP
ncbi:ankyrin repeat domain-containing protein [Actinoplanes sp. NPDC048796]|uniref:ankyrin repeat domain-containing protein n=1 Tax=Actinoplanes sp. NPDC048796 TaxID=3155640 RepID=UPI003401E439